MYTSFLLFTILISIVSCVHILAVSNTKNVPIVLVHGGAGKSAPEVVPYKKNGVKLAVRQGYQRLLETNSVLDAVEAAIHSMERDEYFNAGYGSALNWNGDVENDAAIMDGSTLSAGCVSLLHDVLYPISVARRVMEKSKHVYMAGNGLMDFVENEGIDILRPGSLVTDRARKALESIKNETNIVKKFIGEKGTVGVVVIDSKGNIAAGTSTGGLTGKLPGRIGDSPILGGGTYADNLYGGVSATGTGEIIMRYNAAQKILQLIQFKSMTAQKAVEKVLNDMAQRLNNSDNGVISIDANRNIGVYFTSGQMSWAYKKGKEVHYGYELGDDFVEHDNE